MADDIITPDQWRDDYPNPYQVLVGDTLFKYQGAFRPWSISAPDSGTVRFELHDRDVYGHDAAGMDTERDEFASSSSVAKVGQPLEVSYQFKVEDGAPNDGPWLVMGQLHQSLDATGPGPPPMSIDLIGDHMTILGRYVGADGKMTELTLYTDPFAIQRDHYYDMDIKTIMDPSGETGRLVVVRDGVTIVDYSGPIGDPTMSGVYWAEGIYRQSKATSTIAIDYSNLDITNDNVAFPDKSAFIGVPTLNVVGSTHDDASGGYSVAFAGMVRPGSTVSVLGPDGATVVSTATADANGAFTATIAVPGTGTYRFYPKETDSSGRDGLTSSGFDVVVTTSADAASQLSSLHQGGHLGALVLTDGSVLTVGNPVTLATVLKYAELTRITDLTGDPVRIALDQTVSGKSYDHQISFYSTAGTMLEMERFSAGKLVTDQIYAGATTTTTNWKSDGSYGLVVTTNGVTTLNETFDASGHLTGRQVSYGFGRREVDSYAADGSPSKASVYAADGSRTELAYGIVGRDYVKQATVYAGGQIQLMGRYDVADRLTLMSDAASGLTAQYSYDPASGVRTAYRLVHSDGSYSITTLAGDGSSVVRTDNYTAKGVLVGSDASDPASVMTSISTRVASGAPLTPALSIGTVESGAAGYAVTLSAAGKVGAQVQFLDGTQRIGATTIDATGVVAVPLTSLTSGLHSLTATATDANGATVTTAFDVDIDASAAVLANLATLSQDAALGAIVLTDLQRISVGSRDELSSYLAYGPTLAKVQSGVQFALSESVAGSNFDHQTTVFDGAGTTLQVDRYMNGVQNFAQTTNGTNNILLLTNGDGSYNISFVTGSTFVGSATFDKAGHQIANAMRFADGWARNDSISAKTGAITGSTIFAADKSRLEWTFGVTGRDYATQILDRDPTGKILFVARYDTAQHLTFVNDAANGAATYFQYDANGTVTGYRQVLAGGGYSLTTYAGTDRTVVKTDYFTSKGVMTSEDRSDPGRAIYDTVTGTVAAAATHGSQIGGSLVGTMGNDSLVATSASTILSGGAGNDVLKGGVGDDLIVGGQGADVMTGGGGHNLFWFGPNDFGATSGTSGADRITDFKPLDRIDLSGLENAVAGHVGLSFIGTGAFSGVAGQVHSFEVGGNTYISGDLDGDKLADFTIQLDGHHPIVAANLLF